MTSFSGQAPRHPALRCRGRAAGRDRRLWRVAAIAFGTAGASLSLVSWPTSASAQDTTWSASDSAAIAALHEAVRRTNPELAARRAAVAAAEARLDATGFVAPLVLSGEIENVPDGINVIDAGSTRLDVGRPLFTGRVRAAQRAAVAAEVERARIVLDVVEQRLRARTDQWLGRAVAATAIARRLASEDSLLTGAAEALRTRFSVGEASYVNVLRLRTEQLRVRTERAAALTDAQSNRRALLALLTPADPDEPLPVAVVDSTIARLLRDPLAWPLATAPGIDSLIARSGAVRLADVDVTRFEAEQQLTRAAQRPAVGAALGVQRFLDEDGGFAIGPTVSFSMSLPFTARRANSAARMAAERDLQTANAQRRATSVNMRAVLIDARDRYEAARERLALYDNALLRGAREERETALAAYRNTELSLLELLDFERALAHAEIVQLQTRIIAVDALAELLTGAADLADTGNASRDAVSLRSEAHP